jgi:hypothetical protein
LQSVVPLVFAEGAEKIHVNARIRTLDDKSDSRLREYSKPGL